MSVANIEIKDGVYVLTINGREIWNHVFREAALEHAQAINTALSPILKRAAEWEGLCGKMAEYMKPYASCHPEVRKLLQKFDAMRRTDDKP